MLLGNEEKGDALRLSLASSAGDTIPLIRATRITGVGKMRFGSLEVTTALNNSSPAPFQDSGFR